MKLIDHYIYQVNSIGIDTMFRLYCTVKASSEANYIWFMSHCWESCCLCNLWFCIRCTNIDQKLRNKSNGPVHYKTSGTGLFKDKRYILFCNNM